MWLCAHSDITGIVFIRVDKSCQLNFCLRVINVKEYFQKTPIISTL